MQKKKLTSKCFKSLIIVALCCPTISMAYKQDVHIELTKYASKQSVIGSSDALWRDWGYPGKNTLLTFDNALPIGSDISWANHPLPTTLTAPDIMAFGADVEDTEHEVKVSRALNHFYNPQANQKLDVSFVAPIQYNFTSPDWILEDTKEISRTTCVSPFQGAGCEVQNFSYHDAQVQFFKSLTNQSASDRLKSLGRTIQRLGHVVHHIQDMAQPQHTRLDAHCDSLVCEFFYPENDSDLSVYEVFTYNLLVCDAIDADRPEGGGHLGCAAKYVADWKYDWRSPRFKLSGYPAVNLDTPRDYWHTTDNRGLADFSSRNFITTDTDYSYTGCKGSASLPCDFELDKLGPNSISLPMPNGNPTVTTVQTVLLSDLLKQRGLTVPQGLRDGKLQFIGLYYTDNYTGQRLYNDRMATFSLFTERLTRRDLNIGGINIARSIFSVNYFNLERQIEALLPRAVGYTAGLVNHFFKYRLGVQELSQGEGKPSKWRVTNLSDKTLTANLTTYYDTTDGKRKIVSGANYGERTIKAGQSVDLIGFLEPQDTSGNYIMVASSSRHGEKIGLGGKQFSYAEPVSTVACGSTINASGSSEGFSPPPVNLGNKPGKVTVVFEAFRIPDAMTVKRTSDDAVVASTYGLKSGYHRKYFQHDPDPKDTSTHSVKLEVTGNSDTNTEWNVTLGCPDQSIPDERKTVEFLIAGESGCSADVYIDGSFVRKIYGFNDGDTFTGNYMAGTHGVELKNISSSCQLGTSASYVSLAVYQGGEYKNIANVFKDTSNTFEVK
ncbi:hypothetical protein [Microbulbifer variabilis]|uniref:hypothetical protein n=1 Tax=Microbulbifer variabilis TaxID=266805 RepID=UPI000382E87B|nr:hypothetical protein [Microbulbifer variabilis]